MPPTLKDITSRANVSPALVSMYLNKNPKSRMSAETRQRIDAAIREMNYHPSALARSLRSGKSMTIGYATGNIVGTFSSFRTQMLLQEAYRFGYQLLISLVPFYDYAQEQKILNSLLDSQPAGILYRANFKSIGSLVLITCFFVRQNRFGTLIQTFSQKTAKNQISGRFPPLPSTRDVLDILLFTSA